MALFSIVKVQQDGQNGPLFGDQMALFSVDKNTLEVSFWATLNLDG
jgi:hypothetical protein